MKDSNLLKLARKRIADGKEEYVCFAISDAWREHLDNTDIHSWAQPNSLKEWVMKMLNGAASYEQWLQEFHPEHFQSWDAKVNRHGRLQWLDWMIKQCVKEGR